MPALRGPEAVELRRDQAEGVAGVLVGEGDHPANEGSRLARAAGRVPPGEATREALVDIVGPAVAGGAHRDVGPSAAIDDALRHPVLQLGLVKITYLPPPPGHRVRPCVAVDESAGRHGVGVVPDGVRRAGDCRRRDEVQLGPPTAVTSGSLSGQPIYPGPRSRSSPV